MFLYGNTKLPSKDDKFLYHFTSADSLMKILENMTLKLSSFENLNDLNEKEVNFGSYDWNNMLKLKKYIVDHCQLISFSQNFQNKDQFCQCGCNHPRMWAQYADNNKGACVVINEERFMEENEAILRDIFSIIENVSYFPFINTEEIKESANPELFLKENYMKLFFRKNDDWQQEDEKRLFCISGPDYLSIDNCIEFICLGKHFSKKDYDNLSDVIIDSMERKHTKLLPHDFTFQVNQNGKIICIDNAHRIIENIKSKQAKVNKYLDYLTESGY